MHCESKLRILTVYFSSRKFSHTNFDIFIMTLILQDDHLTAGTWDACGDTSTCLII